MAIQTIGFGGSCHWCTEAIFQSLIGVEKVGQGWMSSKSPNETLSEAVVVNFNPNQISLETLVEIHLLTHSCTSEHSMRSKYRSAIYYFDVGQKEKAILAIDQLQKDFQDQIITRVLEFGTFQLNQETFLNYFKKNPENHFARPTSPQSFHYSD